MHVRPVNWLWGSAAKGPEAQAIKAMCSTTNWWSCWLCPSESSSWEGFVHCYYITIKEILTQLTWSKRFCQLIEIVKSSGFGSLKKIKNWQQLFPNFNRWRGPVVCWWNCRGGRRQQRWGWWSVHRIQFWWWRFSYGDTEDEDETPAPRKKSKDDIK